MAEGVFLGNLGLSYADLGDRHKAIGIYEQALNIAREVSDRRGEGNRLGNLGLFYVDLGCYKAIEFYEQSLFIAREIGDRIITNNASGNLGIGTSNLVTYVKQLSVKNKHWLLTVKWVIEVAREQD